MSQQTPALLATTGADAQLVAEHRQLAALCQVAAAADHAASSALFAEYRAQLAPHTRAAHDHDLARCALYLADAGATVGALASDPAAWAGFTWGLAEGFKYVLAAITAKRIATRLCG